MAKIILVGGGSASGKTYVIEQVIQKLDSKNVTHFSIDDYYKDLSFMPLEERKLQNFDHPKAFDWKLMKTQLIALKNDQEVEKPTYDYVLHNRATKTVKVKPNKLIIVEGIMALVNKDVEAGTTVGGVPCRELKQTVGGVIHERISFNSYAFV